MCAENKFESWRCEFILKPMRCNMLRVVLYKAFAGDPSVWQYLTETQRDVIRVLFKLRNLLEGGDLSLEPSALPSSVLK